MRIHLEILPYWFSTTRTYIHTGKLTHITKLGRYSGRHITLKLPLLPIARVCFLKKDSHDNTV